MGRLDQGQIRKLLHQTNKGPAQGSGPLFVIRYSCQHFIRRGAPTATNALVAFDLYGLPVAGQEIESSSAIIQITIIQIRMIVLRGYP
jgi:hypothetical protein